MKLYFENWDFKNDYSENELEKINNIFEEIINKTLNKEEKEFYIDTISYLNYDISSLEKAMDKEYIDKYHNGAGYNFLNTFATHGFPYKKLLETHLDLLPHKVPYDEAEYEYGELFLKLNDRIISNFENKLESFYNKINNIPEVDEEALEDYIRSKFTGENDTAEAFEIVEQNNGKKYFMNGYFVNGYFNGGFFDYEIFLKKIDNINTIEKKWNFSSNVLDLENFYDLIDEIKANFNNIYKEIIINNKQDANYLDVLECVQDTIYSFEEHLSDKNLLEKVADDFLAMGTENNIEENINEAIDKVIDIDFGDSEVKKWIKENYTSELLNDFREEQGVNSLSAKTTLIDEALAGIFYCVEEKICELSSYIENYSKEEINISDLENKINNASELIKKITLYIIEDNELENTDAIKEKIDDYINRGEISNYEAVEWLADNLQEYEDAYCGVYERKQTNLFDEIKQAQAQAIKSDIYDNFNKLCLASLLLNYKEKNNFEISENEYDRMIDFVEGNSDFTESCSTMSEISEEYFSNKKNKQLKDRK
ncbi:hypothetical protein ACSNZR_001311 [Campylobacter jejuni]